MKKYFLFFFLILLTFTGFSQDVRIVSYPYDTSLFKKHLPNKTFVISEQTNRIYRLTSLATNIQNISTCNKIEIASTSQLADSVRLAFIQINTLIDDTANLVHWSDTTTLIATKHDVDILSNSVYDSLSNHYDLIHALDTGKVSTSGDVMYGGLNIKQGNLSVKGTFNVGNVPLGTDIDSVLTMENGQLKSVDGSSFKPDSTSSGCFNNFYYKQITGCNSNNLYIKADTTRISNKLKLQTFSSVDRPVLTVKDLSGNIDTTETIDIETTPFGFITLTDSLNIGGITYYNYSGNILDDADFSFPLNSYGFGNVYVFNAGMKVEYCRFILNIDGSFELQDNSANVQYSNIDGNVCLYSNAIQNRLGGTRYFMIELKKN